MILGIGTDIIQINRIENILKKYPNSFENKYFSNEELARYKKQNLNTKQFASKLAKLFAGKEAFVKALGTGFRFGISLKDIAILSDKLGKPYIKINGKTKEFIVKQYNDINNLNYYISLSDDNPTGIAFVVIEYKGA